MTSTADYYDNMIRDLKQQFSKDHLDNKQFEDKESILKNKKSLGKYNLQYRSHLEPFIKKWRDDVKKKNNVEGALTLTLL